jgi:hypothetical protein
VKPEVHVKVKGGNSEDERDNEFDNRINCNLKAIGNVKKNPPSNGYWCSLTQR